MQQVAVPYRKWLFSFLFIALADAGSEGSIMRKEHRRKGQRVPKSSTASITITSQGHMTIAERDAIDHELALEKAGLRPVPVQQHKPSVLVKKQKVKACSADCTWNVQISSSKKSNFKTVQIKGCKEEDFHFDGCSATGDAAMMCINGEHTPAGVRVLKNSRDEVVGYGSCCVGGEMDKVVATSVAFCGERPSAKQAPVEMVAEAKSIDLNVAEVAPHSHATSKLAWSAWPQKATSVLQALTALARRYKFQAFLVASACIALAAIGSATSLSKARPPNSSLPSSGSAAEGNDDAPVAPTSWASKRYIWCLLAHIGLINVYAMRINLSEAAEPMQDHFNWSNEQQGYVLSAFFWGYVLFQIPGAILTRRFGGKHVFSIGVLGTSVLTLVTPVCSQSLWLLCVVRALMGLFEATTYPALNDMFTDWVPAPERALLVTFTTAGAYMGTAIALPVSGALIGLGKDAHGVSNTWPYVFYVFGAAGCVWFFLYEIFTTSKPSEHTTISTEELAYLKATTHKDADTADANVSVIKSAHVPWVAFFTHPAALALYTAHFANNYGSYLLMTAAPKFLDEVLGMSMKKAGFVACLPYLLMSFISVGGGFAADRMRLTCPLRLVRILFLLSGFGFSGGFLILLGCVTDSKSLVVAVLCLSVGLSGLSQASYGANFMDISPFCAGQLFGVSNTVANVAGIIAPLVTGYLIGEETGATAVPRWQIVFVIPAIVYGVAALGWVLFMQAKPVQALN